MKEISTYISEKLKLSGTKVLYHPKTKDELQDIAFDLLSKDKNANLNVIDTSEITDMSYLFTGSRFKYKLRNITITGWNTSKVTNFEWMFAGCDEFDADVSNFDFKNSNGSFEKMFAGCLRFKGNGVDRWDIQPINAAAMFLSCKQFNMDVSNWDMSKCKNIKAMFERCAKFTNGGNMKGLDKWGISDSTETRNVFLNADKFTYKPTWFDEDR